MRPPTLYFLLRWCVCVLSAVDCLPPFSVCVFLTSSLFLPSFAFLSPHSPFACLRFPAPAPHRTRDTPFLSPRESLLPLPLKTELSPAGPGDGSGPHLTHNGSSQNPAARPGPGANTPQRGSSALQRESELAIRPSRSCHHLLWGLEQVT